MSYPNSNPFLSFLLPSSTITITTTKPRRSIHEYVYSSLASSSSSSFSSSSNDNFPPIILSPSSNNNNNNNNNDNNTKTKRIEPLLKNIRDMKYPNSNNSNENGAFRIFHGRGGFYNNEVSAASGQEEDFTSTISTCICECLTLDWYDPVWVLVTHEKDDYKNKDSSLPESSSSSSSILSMDEIDIIKQTLKNQWYKSKSNNNMNGQQELTFNMVRHKRYRKRQCRTIVES